jgi:glycosyltransferase involved in cell wall biosynthesis
MRRRLLFVLPDLDGGGAPRVALALLAAMDAQRYQISLLNLGRRGAVLEPQIPAHVRLLHRPRWLPGGLVGARLATLWHGRDQDLLVAGVEMRATFCVHYAARLLRKPSIAWVHIAFEHWARGFGERHRRRSRAAYTAIDELVFVAEGARASMRRWLGRDKPGWRVIPNLFNPAAYAQGSLDATQQRVLQRMRQRPSVIGIGRLETRKGFDLLLSACAKAIAAGADFDVVILGEGGLREALHAEARSLGIADRVSLPGYVANPLVWLQAATLYLMSSRLEGLPTTILEAYACGTPVIATDCPSGPSEMLAGGAGVLVPVDDAGAMADAIGLLLQSPQRRQALADKGRRALQRYLPEAVLPQWDAAIDQALRRKPERAGTLSN